MINREKLDELISETIYKCDNEFNLSDVTIDEVISILSTSVEYKEKIKDIYMSMYYPEWDYQTYGDYIFEQDFQFKAEIAVTRYERNELLKDGVESLLKGYKDDIAHLVIAIREITDALVQANIIIKQQAKEIERLVDLSYAESAGYIKEEK